MSEMMPVDSLSRFLRMEGSSTVVDQGDPRLQRLVKSFLLVCLVVQLLSLANFAFAFLAFLIFTLPGLMVFFLHTLETWPRSFDAGGRRMEIRRPLFPVKHDLSRVEKVTIGEAEKRYVRGVPYTVFVAKAHIPGKKPLNIITIKTERITAEEFDALVSYVCGFMWDRPPEKA